MKQKVCPYCQQEFRCSRFHPDQVVCSSPACQRRRCADYHKKKLAEDDDYRQQCEHSQTIWKENNPGYFKRYRAARKKGHGIRDPHPTSVDDILRFLRQAKNTSAKNNSALVVTTGFVEVWWVSYSGARSVPYKGI
jgi:hypothetical protein